MELTDSGKSWEFGIGRRSASGVCVVPAGRHPVGTGPDRGDEFTMRTAVLYGLIVYEGRSRSPTRVVVAFGHQSDADEYAEDEHLGDYEVVPLSFPTVDPPPLGLSV